MKVVLPEDVEIQKMTLDMGAGAVYAENLVAEELDLDLGAGRAEFDALKVARQAKIDGGAGVLIVRGAEMGKLDLDMGVGKVEIETSLNGDSKVSAGVGKQEDCCECEVSLRDGKKFCFNKQTTNKQMNGTQ